MAKAKAKDKDAGKSKAKAKEKKSSGPGARSDAYVMMLFITFIAIVAGSVLMYLDHEEYGGKTPPKEPVAALPKLGEANKLAPAPVPPAGGGGGGAGGDPMMPPDDGGGAGMP